MLFALIFTLFVCCYVFFPFVFMSFIFALLFSFDPIVDFLLFFLYFFFFFSVFSVSDLPLFCILLRLAFSICFHLQVCLVA